MQRDIAQLQDQVRMLQSGFDQRMAALQTLIDAKAIGAFDNPANYLPSQATQQARRIALPVLRSEYVMPAASAGSDAIQGAPVQSSLTS